MASKTPETPKGAKVSNSSSLNQTPLMIGSGSQPDSSATKQHDLKQVMKEELRSRVYQSSQLLDKIFNTSLPQDLGKVTEDCISKFKESLPPKSGDERAYYVSFVSRLNVIKASLESHQLMEGSIYTDVRFEIYDEVMKEGTGKDAPLQPDIIARVPPQSTLRDHVSWMDVELCVEVKGQYAEMVAQGATYARSIMAAQRSRYFVLIIFYEQKSANVSFGLFTPAWLCLSPKINIETVDGQRQFVRDMARIWSCKSRWNAGFDLTCNNTTCYLEKNGTFLIHRKIFHRISVAGRQTRVDVITDGKVGKTQTDDSHSGIVVYGLHEYTSNKTAATTPNSHTQSSGARRSARLKEKERAREDAATSASMPATTKTSHYVRPCDLPVAYSPPLHKKLILKDSWPILSRKKQEEQVFQNVGCKFGVPAILHSFPVKLQRDNATADRCDTVWFFPDDATKLGLWRSGFNKPTSTSQSLNQQKKDKNEGPEHRVHVRLLIQTEGRPLYEAKGPKQLLQAVLHAMIGYWVIFEKGWVHRDVSSGNVLLMETPERRDKIQGFENILTEDIIENYFDKCTGFISDGDLAVRWDDMDREVAEQRSGTPPYMSRRLISAMATNRQLPHSAIDDLESFVWVLFSSVLHSMEFRQITFTTLEQHYWSCLCSRDLTQLDRRARFDSDLKLQRKAVKVKQQSDAAALKAKQSNTGASKTKESKAKELKDEQGSIVPRDIPSPTFEPFVELLLDWLEFGRKLEDVDLEDLISDGYAKSLRSHVEKYLEIGISHLKRLPDTWV